MGTIVIHLQNILAVKFWETVCCFSPLQHNNRKVGPVNTSYHSARVLVELIFTSWPHVVC